MEQVCHNRTFTLKRVYHNSRGALYSTITVRKLVRVALVSRRSRKDLALRPNLHKQHLIFANCCLLFIISA
jgi:hypothetical protein